MDLIDDYNHTLETYNRMLMQMKLNRGGNPPLLRLLKMKLERLAKEIKAQSSS